MQQKRNTNLSWEFLRAKELNDDQSETNKQTKITMKTIDSTFGCNKSPVQIKSNLLDCDESRERKEKKKNHKEMGGKQKSNHQVQVSNE